MYFGYICSDYALAKILSIIKNGLSIIQLIVPILLILSGIIQFTRLVINPDDNKGLKRVINAFMAAVIVFLLPFTVNLTMSTLSVADDVGIKSKSGVSAFNLSKCWSAVDSSGVDNMDSSSDNSSTPIKNEESNDECPQGKTCLKLK